MSILNNIYQSIKQTVMPKKKPLPGLHEQKEWAKLAKKNKVKMPFFQVEGLTRRTSDGKLYGTMEDFNGDGGTAEKVKIIAKPKW